MTDDEAVAATTRYHSQAGEMSKQSDVWLVVAAVIVVEPLISSVNDEQNWNVERLAWMLPRSQRPVATHAPTVVP